MVGPPVPEAYVLGPVVVADAAGRRVVPDFEGSLARLELFARVEHAQPLVHLFKVFKALILTGFVSRAATIGFSLHLMLFSWICSLMWLARNLASPGTHFNASALILWFFISGAIHFMWRVFSINAAVIVFCKYRASLRLI